MLAAVGATENKICQCCTAGHAPSVPVIWSSIQTFVAAIMLAGLRLVWNSLDGAHPAFAEGACNKLGLKLWRADRMTHCVGMCLQLLCNFRIGQDLAASWGT